MDSVLYDLEFAKNDQRLANVFPKEQETFYTGFVNSIGADGVILNTYDDTGQADGAVYVQFDAIENVEFDSPDLDNMLETIQIAENDQLFTVMDRIPDASSTGIIYTMASRAMHQLTLLSIGPVSPLVQEAVTSEDKLVQIQ